MTFAVLAANAGRPSGPLTKKSEPRGQRERLDLIRDHISNFDPGRVKAQRARLGAKNATVDDLIDAVACLITAYRVSKHIAVVFPDDCEQFDPRGLRVEIVA